MREKVIPWHPQVPTRRNAEDDRTSEVLSMTRELVATISQENPSRLLVGLPAYHLRYFTGFLEVEPSRILKQISVTQESFIDLCNKFDRDIVMKDAAELEQERDPYRHKRLIDTMARAIFRSGLDLNECTNQLNSLWKTEIAAKVEEYNTGQIEFDGLRPADLFEQSVK